MTDPTAVTIDGVTIAETRRLSIDDPAPVPGHLILRDGEGWARLYSLDPDTDGLGDLKDHFEGAYYAGEPAGEVFYVPPQGPIEPLTTRAIATPFDEDDYSRHIIAFTRGDDREAIARISFRVDGRS